MKNGLSEKEASEKLLTEGKNVIEKGKKRSIVKMFLSGFSDFITIVLIISAAVSILLGEKVDGAVIISIVLLNGFMGFFQEYRTSKSIEALGKLTAPVCTVIRDGKRKVISAENVVTGDLVALTSGDRVPADCKIEEGEAALNESLLTGESLPVEKTVHDEIYMGTGVSSGKCTATVYAKGMNTKMGDIARLLDTEEGETPLRRRLEKVGRVLVGVSVFVCIIIAVAGLCYGHPLREVFFSALTLAVAAIPEGLPAAVTVCLAMGVRKMSAKNAIVRKLPAVETLGCTTVICSDKTGTLTKNKMTAVKFYANGQMSDKAEERGKCFDALHLTGKLCCDEATDERIGEATEKAIYAAAKKHGTDTSKYKRTCEVPFSSERRAMSVGYEKDGKWILTVKGAPGYILEKCTQVLNDGGVTEITPKMREHYYDVCDEMAKKALRVLAFAYKRQNVPFKGINTEESELVFVGFIGMTDPPRKEVKAAIKRCYSAGIKPVMITGDNLTTAVETAKQIGIKIADGSALCGDDIEKMSMHELEMRSGEVSVYARAKPEHKLKIVTALKNMGQIAAMTGDGVNDAPALAEADIGIAMGKNGTEVAKESATLVLTDDNFSTIVDAVEEGRVIYNNIRKFVRYLLSCNLGEILLMGCATFMGMPLPLVPIQILWVNLVTDGLPALALGMCKGDKFIMNSPPRNPKESLFAGGLGGNIIFSGLIIGSEALLGFVCSRNFGADIGAARTVCFLTLVIAELIFAVECRNESGEHSSVFSNLYLLLACTASFAASVALCFIPCVSNIFSLSKVGKREIITVLALALIEPLMNNILRSGRRFSNKKIVSEKSYRKNIANIN